MPRSPWLTRLLSATPDLNTAIATCGIGILMLVSLCAPAAKADSVYTYTGNDFTDISGSTYSDTDSINGWFSTALALGDNLSDAGITPTAFNFSNGVEDYTNTTPGIESGFYISTGNNGQITQWAWYVENTETEEVIIESYGDYGGTTYDITYNENAGTGADNENDAGLWNASVPEPSALILLLTSLLGVAFVSRKRIARSQLRATRTDQ
jgi:hypothetical protein